MVSTRLDRDIEVNFRLGRGCFVLPIISRISHICPSFRVFIRGIGVEDELVAHDEHDENHA